MSTFGDRLREERERLALSQTALGGIGGVGKHSQINYEKGEREPGTGYLVHVAAVGVDVAYVLFGLRLEPEIAAVFQRMAVFTKEHGADSEVTEGFIKSIGLQVQAAFTKNEAELIAEFRALSPEKRALVAQTIKTLGNK